MTPYRLYLFDLDGTLFRGDEVLPHAVEVVAELRRRGAGIRYVTNNSSQTRQHFVAKLSKMGFEVSPAEVVSSATGTASYCRTAGVRSAYVVGEPGLVQTLREAGVSVLNALENGLTVPQKAVMGVDAVVAGICRHFDYALMNGAMQQIRGGARYIATNPDTTYPMEGGQLIPGAGSIVAAITACGGQEPFVVGKPNPFLAEEILKETGIPAAETLVVGDRDDTDLECGRRAGCPTYLVLTGVATELPQGQPGGEDLRGLLD